MLLRYRRVILLASLTSLNIPLASAAPTEIPWPLSTPERQTLNFREYKHYLQRTSLSSLLMGALSEPLEEQLNEQKIAQLLVNGADTHVPPKEHEHRAEHATAQLIALRSALCGAPGRHFDPTFSPRGAQGFLYHKMVACLTQAIALSGTNEDAQAADYIYTYKYLPGKTFITRYSNLDEPELPSQPLVALASEQRRAYVRQATGGELLCHLALEALCTTNHEETFALARDYLHTVKMEYFKDEGFNKVGELISATPAYKRDTYLPALMGGIEHEKQVILKTLPTRKKWEMAAYKVHELHIPASYLELSACSLAITWLEKMRDEWPSDTPSNN